MSNKIITYPPGTICLRCGGDKPEVRRLGIVCNVYGTRYSQHMWNKEPVTTTVHYIEPTKPIRAEARYYDEKRDGKPTRDA